MNLKVYQSVWNIHCHFKVIISRGNKYMKKSKFYTMIFDQKKHKTVAEAKEGWTDGIFNYYKEKNLWWAIEPRTGLGILQANTREETRKKANDLSLLAKIEEKVTDELIERFQNLVKEAESQ